MTGPYTLGALALGLSLGLGLLLVLLSCTPRQQRTTTPRLRAGRVRRLLDEAGHHRLPVSALFTAMAASSAVVFTAIFAVTAAAPVAACFAVFALMLPWGLLRWQLARRRRLLSAVWPDVVDHLRSAIRSGLSLSEGLIEVGVSGPAPLREPFAEFGRDWRSGMSMEAALSGLKTRLADPVGDRIILALQITREIGGTDLGRLLSTLSEVLRENSRTRSELEARQSWTLNGAKLAVAAPWIVVLLLSTRPEAVQAYREVTGMAILGVGLVVSVVCYRVMLHIGTLPQEERVLV